MPTAATSPTAATAHYIREGRNRPLCGAHAEYAAPATARPCKRCVTILEKRYMAHPSTMSDFFGWDSISITAGLVNANWGPQANPVLFTREERAEMEALYLATLSGPVLPIDVYCVRHVSDQSLFESIDEATAPTA